MVFVFYPLMTYVDLRTSLQHLLFKKFVRDCSHGKSMLSNPDLLCDSYDGRVWKQFLSYEGRPFLSLDFYNQYRLVSTI